MAKKSKKNQISQDIDGSFYCIKCGQAGYEKQADAWGHLRWCKGFKSVSKQIDKDFQQFNSSFQKVARNNDLNNSENEAGLPLTPPASFYFDLPPKIGPTGAEGEALPEALPEALKNRGGEALNLTKRERIISQQLAESRALNEKLHKYAFNHVQHAVPKNKISSPNDLLMSGLNDLAENVWFQRIIAFGALIWAISWIKENLEKLDRKSSNDGKRSKKD